MSLSSFSSPIMLCKNKTSNGSSTRSIYPKCNRMNLKGRLKARLSNSASLRIETTVLNPELSLFLPTLTKMVTES